MPKTIVKNDIATEVYWEYNEWCQALPEWWLRNCGCQRKCKLNNGLGDALFDMSPIYVKHILRYGIASIQGWVLKLIDKKNKIVAIYPWPKHLHKSLF